MRKLSKSEAHLFIYLYYLFIYLFYFFYLSHVSLLVKHGNSDKLLSPYGTRRKAT